MKAPNEKILVVSDEAFIRRVLETRLSLIGYDVVTAADGEEALDTFRKADPYLVVLDVMMPKLDGYSICQQLRKESDVPIIMMLPALTDVADQNRCLELGANDYVVKPFSPKALEYNIRLLLRQHDKVGFYTMPSSGIIVVGNIKIGINKWQVYKGDEWIVLTHEQFSILQLFVSHPGKTFSRAEIAQEVWGYSGSPSLVDIHIVKLRAKLEDDYSNPELFIKAPSGTGYLFRHIIESESK